LDAKREKKALQKRGDKRLSNVRDRTEGKEALGGRAMNWQGEEYKNKIGGAPPGRCPKNHIPETVPTQVIPT